MRDNGVKVYFVSKAEFRAIESADDDGEARLRRLTRASKTAAYRRVRAKASGYDFGKRSGTISFNIPGDVNKKIMHPGGVDDHHVTMIYLGSDVDDDTYA